MSKKEAEPIDWQRTCMRLLECFGCNEGIWYEGDWSNFGITEADSATIKESYAKWMCGQLGKQHKLRQT